VVESSRASSSPRIREGLRGKHVLITGVTGFLGMAVFERLLSEFPDTSLSLLVRGRYGSPPEARLRELLSRPAFNGFRERVGAPGVEDAVERRVTLLEGDVAGDLPALPGDLDVVFHCAADVSFDSPIDQAFQINLFGARRLYEAVQASGSRAHLVHVSTAYVAGLTKGVVPEESLAHRVDWREEGEAAAGARATAEAASRRPEMLDHFVSAARKEHGRAGPQEVASSAEERRRKWVDKRLVEYGRARAQAVGWPDVYTFTKALGERAAEEFSRDSGLPLSIVRPAIVESALRHPFPGWIEGFKMAEPIILAYGRGAIPEFPAIPEGIMDIIPVDLVVNAMLAVAVTTPDGAPRYYHVCSGSRNPLTFYRLYQLVHDYFHEHPLPERGRGEFRVPEWQFPGRRRVEARLRTGERLIDGADKVVSRLPRSDRIRDWVHRLDRTRGRLEFVRRYADLYGSYTEIEVIYTDDRTLDLFRSLAPEDQEDFGFDCIAVDWAHYLQEVHCPTVTVAMRFPGPARPEPAVRVRPRENGVLALFDMEGTLLDSNVVESYLWLRMAELPSDEWPAKIAAVATRLPRYLGAERRDRGEFLRSFYQRYAGASTAGIARLMDERVGELVLRRLSAGAVRRIREHRSAGHRTIVITGALDVFVRPLAPLFDDVLAARLETENGRYTGRLASPPVVGEARAAWIRSYAAAHGADLKGSYAYADSHSDLPMLRAVGNPVAVNPDVALYRVARKRRWPIEDWKRSKGTPRVLVPERGVPAVQRVQEGSK
jgi:fatty acyl-CoA reductase